MTRLAAIAFFMFSILFPAAFLAQQNGTGFPPYSSIQVGDFDSINLETLNVHHAYPIVSASGRGLGLGFSVTYDSAVWGITSIGGNKYWSQIGGSRLGNWIIEPGNGSILGGEATELCSLDQQYNQHWSNFSYTEPNGTVHPFDIDYYEGTTACFPDANPGGGYATDASGYFLSTVGDNFFVITPGGIQIISGGASGGNTYDTNGNFLHQPPNYPAASTDDTDSVGRVALSVVRIPTPQPATIVPTDHYDYKFLDVNGNYQTVTLHFQTFNVKTNFGCIGITEYSASNVALPTSLVYPDGRTYAFTYEDTPGFPGYTTMLLKRVTLPTGGYYEYQYGTSCDGNLFMLKRLVNDGTNTSTWTYSRNGGQVSPTLKTWETWVTKPELVSGVAANQCTYSFIETDDATTGGRGNRAALANRRHSI